jgi:starvation-inducible DNA-binding protein
LAERYGQVANTVRKAVSESAEAGDANSSDIFTEVSRGLDKQLWFLEAHLEE